MSLPNSHWSSWRRRLPSTVVFDCFTACESPVAGASDYQAVVSVVSRQADNSRATVSRTLWRRRYPSAFKFRANCLSRTYFYVALRSTAAVPLRTETVPRATHTSTACVPRLFVHHGCPPYDLGLRELSECRIELRAPANVSRGKDWMAFSPFVFALLRAERTSLALVGRARFPCP